MVVLKSEKANTLIDGTHIGKIMELEIQEKESKDGVKYSFLDLMILSEAITVRCGISAKLYPNSELGKIMTRFGFDGRRFGEEIDLDLYLKEKTIQFKTLTQEAKNGKYYSNVIPESINPIQAV